jgi:hypothetical protein
MTLLEFVDKHSIGLAWIIVIAIFLYFVSKGDKK